MFVIMQIVLNLIQQMHGVKKHMTYPLKQILQLRLNMLVILRQIG